MCSTSYGDADEVGLPNNICKREPYASDVVYRKQEKEGNHFHTFVFHNYHEKPDFRVPKNRSISNAYVSKRPTPALPAPSPISSPTPTIPCWITSNSPTTNIYKSPTRTHSKSHDSPPKNLSPTNPTNTLSNPTNSPLSPTRPQISTSERSISPLTLDFSRSPTLPPTSPTKTHEIAVKQEPTNCDHSATSPIPSHPTSANNHNSPPTHNTPPNHDLPGPTATSPKPSLRIIIKPHFPRPTPINTHDLPSTHDPPPIHVSSPTHDLPPTHISSPSHDLPPIHVSSPIHESTPESPRLSEHSLYPSPIPDDTDHPPLTHELCTAIVEFLFKFVEKTRDQGILRDTAYKTYDAFSKGLLEAPGVHLVKITPKMGGQFAQLVQHKGKFELQNYARYCQGVAGSTRIGIEFEPGTIATAVSEWVAIANTREELKRERRRMKQEQKRERDGAKKRSSKKLRHMFGREEDKFYYFVDVKPEPQFDSPTQGASISTPISSETGTTNEPQIDVNQLFQDTSQLLSHIAAIKTELPD